MASHGPWTPALPSQCVSVACGPVSFPGCGGTSRSPWVGARLGPFSCSYVAVCRALSLRVPKSPCVPSIGVSHQNSQVTTRLPGFLAAQRRRSRGAGKSSERQHVTWRLGGASGTGPLVTLSPQEGHSVVAPAPSSAKRPSCTETSPAGPGALTATGLAAEVLRG